LLCDWFLSQVYSKLTRAYSFVPIVPSYLLVIGVGIAAYIVSFNADQTPKYARICFTSYAYDLDETFGSVFGQVRAWGGIISVLLFLVIVVLMKAHTQVR
jgi:hypothetical protein